ncbi:hypothetical protein K432DRAFT_465531 [Lepidopterella palustris CBS 459.81]|uniref:Zn(2)-C6 fungal-type domain-containing protein n=1 Tax=Lepidopterella palustris CBS 459.81 TaxID=1314670 RepID=A0A8E2JB65_9PEZI|nr:hypothetical protein K432DRAFT_465531 [Lepidopterella palustris CBS 459.81]
MLELPEKAIEGLAYPTIAQLSQLQMGGGYDSGESSLYDPEEDIPITADSGYSSILVEDPIDAAQFTFAPLAPSFMSYTTASEESYFPQYHQYLPQLAPSDQIGSLPAPLLAQTQMDNWSQTTDVDMMEYMATSAGSLSGSSWGMVSERPSTTNTPVYDRTSEDSDGYELIHPDGSHGSKASSTSPLRKVETLSDSPPSALSDPTSPKLISEEKAIPRPKLPKIASSFSQRASKSKVCKRKGKMSEEGRAKAAEMRKNGPCIRCRLYKLGCDGNNPCKRCLKVTHSARSFLEPCSRANLDTVSLVRHSNGRFNQANVFFRNYRWVSVDGECPTMDVRWNLPGSTPIRRSTIPVQFRSYRPETSDDCDSTTYRWQVNGVEKMIELPPYAVYDTGALLDDVERFVIESQPEVEAWILEKWEPDSLAFLTFKEAMRYRSQLGSNIIALALQIQCGAIMSQGYGSVMEAHIPGLFDVDYRTFGHCGYEAYDRARDRPLPQAMGHQFDVAILKYINRLQKALLKDLRKKIFQPGIKPWYELFLTFFILLSNLEYIHGGALGYMNSKMQTMLESQVSYVVRSQMKEWEFSAGVMLQHFRCVLRGFLPFQLARDNIEELKDKAKLDETSVNYVRSVVPLLENQLNEERNAQEIFAFSANETSCAAHEASVAKKWIPQLFMESYG